MGLCVGIRLYSQHPGRISFITLLSVKYLTHGIVYRDSLILLSSRTSGAYIFDFIIIRKILDPWDVYRDSLIPGSILINIIGCWGSSNENPQKLTR